MEHYLCRPIVELPAYMQDKFIVPKGEITTTGSYGIVVRATDKDGQTKNSVTTAFNIN